MTSQFTLISLNFSVLDNFSCELGANNNQVWPHMGQPSNVRTDSQLYLISILVNFPCELGQIIARYDFPEAIRVILAMFEPTPTWPNFYFGQFCIIIEANNDQICLPRGEMSYFEQCSNRLKLKVIYLLLLLVNVWFSASNDQIWLLVAR